MTSISRWLLLLAGVVGRRPEAEVVQTLPAKPE